MKKVILAILCIGGCFEEAGFGMGSPEAPVYSPFTPQSDCGFELCSDSDSSDGYTSVEEASGEVTLFSWDEYQDELMFASQMAAMENMRQCFPSISCGSNPREVVGFLCDIEGVEPNPRMQNFYTTVSRSLRKEEVSHDAPAFVYDLPIWDW